MKKMALLILAPALVVGISACGKNDPSDGEKTHSDSLSHPDLGPSGIFVPKLALSEDEFSATGIDPQCSAKALKELPKAPSNKRIYDVLEFSTSDWAWSRRLDFQREIQVTSVDDAKAVVVESDVFSSHAKTRQVIWTKSEDGQLSAAEAQDEVGGLVLPKSSSKISRGVEEMPDCELENETLIEERREDGRLVLEDGKELRAIQVIRKFEAENLSCTHVGMTPKTKKLPKILRVERKIISFEPLHDLSQCGGSLMFSEDTLYSVTRANKKIIDYKRSELKKW